MTYKKLPECETCTLREQPGIVWGAGDLDHAKLVYIAQNPGEHEVGKCYCHKDAPMEPLVGPSGNIFNRQLAEAHIRRSELFITNQVKCLTPNNRAPTPHEIRCCRPILERELKRCKADTVILAGDTAFDSNMRTYSTLHKHYHPADKKGNPVGIMTRMGCVEQKDGRKWIGTIHPAFVMRMPDFRGVATEHLRKAWRLAGTTVPLPQVEYPVNDSYVKEYVEYILRESYEFSDDVETVQPPGVEEDDYVGGDWQLTKCGISGKPYHGIVLKTEQIPLLAPLFASNEIWQYEHNGEYDRFYLDRAAGRTICKRFDTMLGHHLLRSNVHKRLKPAVVSIYTNLPYYNRDLEKVDADLYCGMDVVATFLAAREIIRQMRAVEVDTRRWA